VNEEAKKRNDRKKWVFIARSGVECLSGRINDEGNFLESL
jgi:hypothetical protein